LYLARHYSTALVQTGSDSADCSTQLQKFMLAAAAEPSHG